MLLRKNVYLYTCVFSNICVRSKSSNREYLKVDIWIGFKRGYFLRPFIQVSPIGKGRINERKKKKEKKKGKEERTNLRWEEEREKEEVVAPAAVGLWRRHSRVACVPGYPSWSRTRTGSDWSNRAHVVW